MNFSCKILILFHLFFTGSSYAAESTKLTKKDISNIKIVKSVDSIRYVPGPGTPRIDIEYRGNLKFKTKFNENEKRLLLEFSGAQLPANLTRAIDASVFPGPVEQITPYNSAEEDNVGGKIFIQLRKNAKIDTHDHGGVFTVIFKSEKKDISKIFDDEREDNSRKFSQRRFTRREWVEDRAKAVMAAPTRKEQQAAELIRALNKDEGPKVYKGTKITLESSNVSVHDVFRLVGATSGLNIVTSTDVSGQVNLSLRDVPWDQLLDIVLTEQKLKATVTGNVIRITTLTNYQEQLELKTKIQKIEKREEPTIMAIIPLAYTSADSMQTALATLLLDSSTEDTSGTSESSSQSSSESGATSSGNNNGSSSSSDSSGGSGEVNQVFKRGAIAVDERTNSLLVTHTQEQIDRIRRLVKELDTPAPQVLVESRIVSVTENLAKSLGFNWNGTILFPSTRSAFTLGTGAFSAQPATRAVTPENDTSANAVTLSDFTFARSSTQGGGIGSAFRVVGKDGQNFNFTVDLSETDNRARTLATPRVIVENNQQVNISDAGEILRNTVTISEGSTSISQESVSTGVSLKFTPQVTNTGKILLKDLEVSNSVPVGDQSTTQSQSIKTRVTVDNGESFVIGGNFQISESDRTQGIPLLKDLPIVGTLFKSNDNGKARSELLVFVKPTIMPVDRDDVESKLIESL